MLEGGNIMERCFGVFSWFGLRGQFERFLCLNDLGGLVMIRGS